MNNLYLKGKRMGGVALYEQMPVGSFIDYAGTVAPKGYKKCDGSAISRTDYPELFNIIGTTYGDGDGSTTFNLPTIENESGIKCIKCCSVATKGSDVLDDSKIDTGHTWTSDKINGDLAEYTKNSDLTHWTIGQISDCGEYFDNEKLKSYCVGQTKVTYGANQEISFILPFIPANIIEMRISATDSYYDVFEDGYYDNASDRVYSLRCIYMKNTNSVKVNWKGWGDIGEETNLNSVFLFIKYR